MAALGSKGSAMTVVIAFSLLMRALQPSSVEAVNVLIYNTNSCTGPGTEASGCYNIDAGACCTLTGGAPAIEIDNLLNGESATVYTGGGCSGTTLANPSGPLDNICFFNIAISGVIWNFSSKVANGTEFQPTGSADVTAIP